MENEPSEQSLNKLNAILSKIQEKKLSSDELKCAYKALMSFAYALIDLDDEKALN